MGQHLALTIRLHDERYHGMAEWPPGPARAFQALVAGAAEGAALPPRARAALEWLERLPAPIIACPRAHRGQRVEVFVPNNDADALDGDLDRVSEIRTKKVIVPRLLAGDEPFVYVWSLESAGAAASLVDAAERVYQFGRGVDMAWAVAHVCDDDAVERLLSEYPGTVHRPTPGHGLLLACPTIGSLSSLVARHEAAARRLRVEGAGKQMKVLFAQPPKPRFQEVAYDTPHTRLYYELRTADGRMLPWPPWRIVALVERLRDGAAARLREALPDRAHDIERALVGRKADGADAAPTHARVRVLPLASIGHESADRAVRRIVVEVPPGALLAASDVHWAFSGLAPHDEATGEVDFVVTASVDERMADHFTRAARTWRTITPAALPEAAKRRRIDPARQRDEAKSAAERSTEERRAAAAVRTALRHAGVRGRIMRISVQREPFDLKGARAERFAAPPRFARTRLWHVEIEFAERIEGPLAIGDGRFLGLGLLAPTRAGEQVIAFEIMSGQREPLDPFGAARALRRAVMARVQEAIGNRHMPTFFSGHEASGEPAKRERSGHLSFQVDADRLLIIPPHVLDRRRPEPFELKLLETLGAAVEELALLNAGSLGQLSLRRAPFSRDDSPLFGTSRVWRSVNPFTVNRHAKCDDATTALATGLIAACLALRLPRPEVVVESARGVPGRGLEGHVRIRFPRVVAGPLVVGRTRYLGGGLFAAEPGS